MATTPFIRDVPAAEALAAWRAACAAAGCPARVETNRVGLHEAVGRVTAEPVWATRSSPSFDASAMDGIAVRAADTIGASESTPVFVELDAYVVLDTGDPMPDGFDAVVMREHVHYDDAGRAELRSAVAPYQHVRSIGEDVSATELLLPTGHRLRAVDVAAARRGGRDRPRRPSRARRRRAPDGRRDPAGRHGAGAGGDPRHELADARRAGRGRGLHGVALADRPRRPGGARGGGARCHDPRRSRDRGGRVERGP